MRSAQRIARTFLAALLVNALLSVVLVRAQFFQHIFNNAGGGGAFQQREQEPPSTGDAKWFDERVQAATCSKFLCPRTLSCVDRPAQCPCPFEQQIRCSYPESESGKLDDGGFVCVQEPNCDRVDQLRRLGQNFKLSDLK